MEDLAAKPHVTRSLKYELTDSPVVFRIAWFAGASRPGVRLTDETEVESQDFEGKALFETKMDENELVFQLVVLDTSKSFDITVWGEDEGLTSNLADSIVSEFESAVKKYQNLGEEEQTKVRKALVAKTCLDRIVYYILKGDTTGRIYFQLAHAREMMIKATSGEDVSPVALSTAGWLAQIEKLPRDEKMPAEMARELAKKSIEWKSQVHEFIKKYL